MITGVDDTPPRGAGGDFVEPWSPPPATSSAMAAGPGTWATQTLRRIRRPEKHRKPTLGQHGGQEGETEMSLRHISPRSVEWYEALIEGEDETLAAHEALALRTMKALEDAEIRIALARLDGQDDGPLSYRFPSFQLRHA
jgi:hypothetical protein